MKIASESYLRELAEEFLSGQTAISWNDYAESSLKGETVWVDPTDGQPGIDVEFSYRRAADSIVIEITAYQQDDDDGRILASHKAHGTVTK